MRIADIIAAIETTAPLFAAAPWDVSGMQVAARRTEITRLAVCLDPLPGQIRAAAALGADMVLSHHPLLLKARLPSRLDGYHETLSLLFRHDMPLYAAHTSLDANPHGPAGWVARLLELSGTEILEQTAEKEGRVYGFGFCGEIAPRTLDQILDMLRPHISLDNAMLCGRPAPDSIHRIACCPGSGASLLGDAARLGADLYITGDVKYHTALDAELCVLDVGHHSLEEELMRRFAQELSRNLSGTEVVFLPSGSPFHRVH